MASAEFRSYTRTINYNTGDVKDTGFNEHIKAKGGFGVIIGNSFRLAKMGDFSCLALDVDFMYNSVFWESGGFSYSSNSQTGTTSSGSGTVSIAMPIGISYKYGCDAAADKSKRFCASVGAGINPTLAGTVFRDQANGNFRMLSYLKGEVGIFAGICMKLRGTLSFGKLDYIDYSNNFEGQRSETSLKGKSAFTLSLIFMPMSFKWGRVDWFGRGRHYRY